MGALGVDSEVKVIAGRGGGTNNRLDLARWDDSSIEIGEIKPNHATGLAHGRADLEHYKGVLEKTKNPLFKGKTVRMLDAAAPPPMMFANPGVALPEPQMMSTVNIGGVYGYKCEPPNGLYFEAGGKLKPGDKHVTAEVLKAKKDFFNSDCIKKKTKRQAVQDERVKIVDRAGVTRLVKPTLAFSLLQSRAFHVRRELDVLSGEHHERHRIATRSVAGGLMVGGPIGASYSAAALFDLATMPSLSIWAGAQTAAAKCGTASDLKALALALDELDKAMTGPRYEYLTFKGANAATPNTPAPAAGSSPQQGQAPPLPPPAPKPAAPDPTVAPKPADGGITALEIAALAGLVLLTFLILQPELGAAAVAGTVAGGGAEVAGTAAAAEALVGGAATAAETGLELACEEMVTDSVLAAAGA